MNYFISKFPSCRISKFLGWVILGIVACSSPQTDDEVSIRGVREQNNTAIAAHDSTALSLTLTTDYNVVTSRNAVSSSRTQMLQRLATDWTAKPDLFYRRTPLRIEVYSGWRMAGETGTWVGNWTEANGDKISLTGSYYAKWHSIRGHWQIRAEIFTPLGCAGGSYCEEGPLAH